MGSGGKSLQDGRCNDEIQDPPLLLVRTMLTNVWKGWNLSCDAVPAILQLLMPPAPTDNPLSYVHVLVFLPLNDWLHWGLKWYQKWSNPGVISALWQHNQINVNNLILSMHYIYQGSLWTSTYLHMYTPARTHIYQYRCTELYICISQWLFFFLPMWTFSYNCTILPG